MKKRLLRSSLTAKSCSLNNSQKCLRFFAIFRSSSASAKICQKNKLQRHLTSTTQVGTTSKHIYGKLKNDEKVKSQCQLYAYLTSTTQVGTTSKPIDYWKIKQNPPTRLDFKEFCLMIHSSQNAKEGGN